MKISIDTATNLLRPTLQPLNGSFSSSLPKIKLQPIVIQPVMDTLYQQWKKD